MKRGLWAVIALSVGVIVVKFIWILLIFTVIVLLTRFSFRMSKRTHKEKKDNTTLWQSWDER